MVASTDRKLRVGFVVQRCGTEVTGGAELSCLQIAQHMSKHWDTVVLTTCALDYMEWRNYYPEGCQQCGGTTIHRFPVDTPRDVEQFNALSRLLRSRHSDGSLEDQENWMRAQGPMSSALFTYLDRSQDSFDAFFFFGYLYATTYFGLPLVKSKAWLVPLAHDEWPIWFSMWDAIFRLPQGFVFQTEQERLFVRNRFSSCDIDGPVIGLGIDPPKHVNAAEFRAKYRLTRRILLYVGRVDESKGCAQLFDYFSRATAEAQFEYDLVVIGAEVMPVPFHDNIIYLGVVSEEDKWNAMAAADWLVMPSPHESLCIAVLESWAVKTPVLVMGQCAVLVAHCYESNGGLWYEDYFEWRSTFSVVTDEVRQRLGEQGNAYVMQRYTWTAVEQAYLALQTNFQT